VRVRVANVCRSPDRSTLRAVRGRLNPSIDKIIASGIAVRDQFFDEFRKRHASAPHEILDRVGNRRVRFGAAKKTGELLKLAERALTIKGSSLDRRRNVLWLGVRSRRRLGLVGGRPGFDVGERRGMRPEPIEDSRKGLA
jgi:hypothetical protein